MTLANDLSIDRDTARRRTTLALRGSFFAQWRMQRSAALHGHRPRPRAKVRDALNKRLRLAILRDWVLEYAAIGRSLVHWAASRDSCQKNITFYFVPPTQRKLLVLNLKELRELL